MSTRAILNSARKAVEQAKRIAESRKSTSPARSCLSRPPSLSQSPLAQDSAADKPKEKRVAFTQSTSENESSMEVTEGRESSGATSRETSGDTFNVSPSLASCLSVLFSNFFKDMFDTQKTVFK